MLGERGGRRIVEDQGRGQPQPRDQVHPVAHLDRGQGVEAQVVERTLGADLLVLRVAEDGGRLGTDQIEYGGRAAGLVERREQLGEGIFGGALTGTAVRGGACGKPYEAAQHGRDRFDGNGSASPGHIEGGRHEQGVVEATGGVEEGQALRGLHGADAGPADAAQLRVVEVRRHAAAVGPQSPGQRGGRQSPCPAVLGEGVEEDVGRGVVALSGAAEGGGDRREHDEGTEVQVLGELVQRDRRVHLGTQYGGNALGGEGGEDAVVRDARGVHDRGQRVLGRNRGQQGRELCPVGHVAGRDGDGGAQCGQFGLQLRGALRRGPSPADEEQVADAVGGHQVTREQLAEGAGGTGHQHGARGVGERGESRVGRLCPGPGEPGYPYPAGPDGELRFAVGQRLGKRAVRGGQSVDVGQGEPARVLRLCRTDEAPYGRLRDVLDLVIGGRGDGTAGDEDDAGVREPLVLEQDLGERQHAGDRAVRRLDRVGARFGHARDEEGAGSGEAVVDRLAEFVQVGEPAAGRETEVAVAQDDPVTGVRGRAGALGDRPVDPEERVVVGAAGRVELLRGDGAQHGRPDGGDGRPGLVGECDGHGVGAGGREPHPERRCAGGVQRHTGPGERQPFLAGAALVTVAQHGP